MMGIASTSSLVEDGGGRQGRGFAWTAFGATGSRLSIAESAMLFRERRPLLVKVTSGEGRLLFEAVVSA
jgi:hypothetical protein